ncbi:MAG: hypothetical protein K8R88_15505 [Armatimonadetes bacterium]|nr:hypothetical protein [Armatimonadota bacterium]
MKMGQVDLLLEHDFDRKYYYWMLITSIFLGTLCFGAFIFGTFYSYSSNGILTGLIFGIVGLYLAYRGRLHYLSFKLGASYRFCPEDSTFNLNY